MNYYYSSTAKSINVFLLCIVLMPLIALRGLYRLWKEEREGQGRLAAVFIVSMMPLPLLLVAIERLSGSVNDSC